MRKEADVLVFLPGFARSGRHGMNFVRMRTHLWPTSPFFTAGFPGRAARVAAAHRTVAPIILATNVTETSLTIPGVRAGGFWP
jgi:HrpA-like RNA helicase